MLLGEAASKVEHLAHTPLPPEIMAEMHRIYLSRGVQATTAIEGNTLSEEQVLEAIDGTLDLPPSQRYLQKEVENVLTACNWVAAAVARGERYPLTVDSIREFNRQVLDGLELEEGVVPGELRTHPVTVGSVYRAVPPECCEELLTGLVRWLARDEEWKAIGTGDTRWETAVALVKALTAHLYVAWIHPFGDGNGRTARLVELTILANARVPLPAAHLLSNHFNQTRQRYYRELSLAAREPGNIDGFLAYAAQGFVDGLVEQLRHVNGWVFALAWSKASRDAIRQQAAVDGTSEEVQDRRVKLSEALAAKGPAGVERSEIETLNEVVARLYLGRTPKTVSRDLNALRSAGLITSRGRRVSANLGLLSEFMPRRVL